MTVYLDNAATTLPKPRTVVSAVNDAVLNFSANPGRGGHSRARRVNEMIYSVREKVSEFFSADSAENVVFTPNCTAALNTAIQGIFKNGGHAVISPFEHNAVVRPLSALEKYGVSYDVAEYFEDRDKTVRSFERLIRQDTKAIVCTHASNVFGMIMPIRELGALCESYGIYFIVDAAQTAGFEDINIGEMKIGSLCVAAHKGLYAPAGAGLMITDGAPEPLIFGGTGGDSRPKTQPKFLPDKYESGTLNVCSVAGIGAGLKFVTQKRAEFRTRELFRMLQTEKALRKIPKVILYTDRSAGGFVPVLSFNIEGMHSEQTAKLLDSRGICVRAGLHCAPLAHETMGTIETGTARIAFSAFTTDNDIDRFVSAVRAIAR